jgi:hypothetical protein
MMPPIPGTGGPASTVTRVGKGAANVGSDAVKNNGGITAIMAAVFGVVALAKIRGKAQINTAHALFGGFILLFILTALYRINRRLGLAFAALVLIQALLEYGPAALNGLSGSAPAPLVSGINQNVPTGLQGAIGGDINSHPDTLPSGQGGLSDVFGKNGAKSPPTTVAGSGGISGYGTGSSKGANVSGINGLFGL